MVQVAMGVALLVGRRLARQRRFGRHLWCQTSVMLLNPVMIALVMLPSFTQQVSPNLAKSTSDPYYALPLIHAVLGSAAELLGLYVVLVATGARIVPVALRFRNYRAWMRATLWLWWTVIGLGLGTYLVWYGAERTTAPAATMVQPAAPAALPDVTVTVQNFNFEPQEIRIPAGTTVIWNDTGGRHTVESADGLLKSDTLIGGQSYSKRFDTPGTYDYFCGNHGTKAGAGMVGRVIVTPR